MLPDFYTLVLNNCQQFTIAERESTDVKVHLKSIPYRMCIRVLGVFLLGKLDINCLIHKFKKKLKWKISIFY